MAFDDQLAPEHGTSQAQGENNGPDYERSYNELRPEYTRATQELAQVRESLSDYEQLFEALSNPETQSEALAMLGFQVDAGTSQDEVDEFVDPLEQELEALRAQVSELTDAQTSAQAQAEEAELIAIRDDYIGETITFIEDQTKSKFSQREEEVLGNLAIAMADENGIPDVQGAYNAIYGNDGVLETRRSQWIQSKTGAFTAPLGSSIPAEHRPQTARDRVNYIDSRLQAFDQE